MGKKKGKTMQNFLQENQRLGFFGSDLNEYANIFHTAYLAKNTNKAAEPNSSHRQINYKNPYMGNSVVAAPELKQHNLKDKNSVLPKCPYCCFEHRTKQLCDKSPRYQTHLLNIINKVPVNKPKPPALTLCWFCRALGHKKACCVGVKMKKEKQYGIQSEANTCMNLKACESNKQPQLNCSLCEWRRNLGLETLPHVTTIGNTKVQCPGTMKEDNRIVVNNKDTTTSDSASETQDTIPTTTTSKVKSKGKTKTISPSKSTTPTSIKENPDSPQTVRTVIPQTNVTTSTSLTKTIASVKSDSTNSTVALSKGLNPATKQKNYEWETFSSERRNRIIEPVSEHAWWLKDGAVIPEEEIDMAYDNERDSNPVFINGEGSSMARNYNTSVTIVRPDCVKQSNYTGEKVYIRTSDGLESFPLAEVTYSVYLTGRIKVMVMENENLQVIDNYRIIIGNTYKTYKHLDKEEKSWCILYRQIRDEQEGTVI